MEYKKAELHMSTKMKLKILVVECKESSQREIPYINVCVCVCVCVCINIHKSLWVLSSVQLFVNPWTVVAHQAPLSMEFSRQEYWSVLPFPSPGDLPNPGIESRSPALQADSLPSEQPGKPYTFL